MCADPLRGFVFVLSRLQISQAWNCGATVWLRFRNPAARALSSTDLGVDSNIISCRSALIFFQFWVAFPDPASKSAVEHWFGGEKKTLWGSHPQIQRPARPRAGIWGRRKSKQFWGRASRSNVQGALERRFEGGKETIFLGSHPQIQRPERPRARIWEGKKKYFLVTRGQIQCPERPRARIWGGKKKYFLEQAPDPTPRAPSSADLRGQTQDFGGHTARSNGQGAPRARTWEATKKIFWNKPQIQRPGRPRTRIWGGKLKILGVAFPDPTSRAPSSADLGGQKQF